MDTRLKPGQSLVGYKVLGELPGKGPRRFAVHLELRDPPERRDARFVVVGKDPIWVLTEYDFDMLAHWEHLMESQSTQGDAASGDEQPR